MVPRFDADRKDRHINSRVLAISVQRVNVLCWLTHAKIINTCGMLRKLPISGVRAEMQGMGIHADVLDSVPDLGQPRHEEIQQSLEQYRSYGISAFVIIDDDADMGSLSEHLVCVDPQRGFGEGDYVKAVAILERWV